MKLFELVLAQPKKLTALLLMAVASGAASADQYLADAEPTAPCGDLHQVGHKSYLHNLSDTPIKSNSIHRPQVDGGTSMLV